MKAELLLEYTATLGGGMSIGPGPAGRRGIVNVTGGYFEGPELRGKVLACGGDWALGKPSGFTHLDVRLTLETDDGAAIYVQYYGIAELTDAATAAMSGGPPTEYGDLYYFTHPRFETGDPRYSWINDVFAIAEGRLLTIDGGPAVAYRVSRLRTG